MTPNSNTSIRIGRVTLVPAQRQVLLDDEPVHVGGRAFDLLQALAVRTGQIVSKRDLLDLVWPGMVVEENNLQVQVCALRKLLGTSAIVTVPGRGYTLAAAVAVDEGRPPIGLAAPSYCPAPGDVAPLRGRESELASLAAMLDLHRFVTVAGPAGVGKSRLVHEALAHLAADNATKIELAAVPKSVTVAAHVARVLHLDLPRSPAPGDVARALATRARLLVVENAECRLDELAALADAILARAPGIRILCTSQAPLKCRDEFVLRLGPLQVPDHDHIGDAPYWPAVLLLHDALTALQPRGEFARGEVPDALAICRHLDGLPLAIHLAGSRVPLLGLAGVRRMLADRFRLLKAETRGSAPRHASLLASLQWSWGLLSQRERLSLAAVARFPGRFTLPMARQAMDAIATNEWEAMELLAGLVDKSMVVAESGGRSAFRLLESTRLFARARLGECAFSASTPDCRPPVSA